MRAIGLELSHRKKRAEPASNQFTFAMTNRRQFLWGCSALTLTASFAPAACFSSLRPLREVTLDQVSFASLSAQVGTGFSLVCSPAAPATLQLVEATLTPSIHPQAHRAEDAGNEKFSLLFCGPKEPVLTQDTHLFEHAGIGRFEMFIVPIGAEDPNRSFYQAVFNRPMPETST